MKGMILKPTVVEARTVVIEVPNRYGNGDIPLDFPGLSEDGKTLRMSWDIDTGVVIGWPKGRVENLALKVTDRGTYHVYDSDGAIIASRVKGRVPHSIVPGYGGDHIKMEIDGFGKIVDYKACLQEFLECDCDEAPARDD